MKAIADRGLSMETDKSKSLEAQDFPEELLAQAEEASKVFNAQAEEATKAMEASLYKGELIP